MSRGELSDEDAPAHELHDAPVGADLGAAGSHDREGMPLGGSDGLDGLDDAGPFHHKPRAEHMFRAAPMTLVQMYISHEVARDAVGRFGELGCVHFNDLNAGVSAFARLFVPQLRRLDESARLLRQLVRQAEFPGSIVGAQGLPAPDPDLLREPLLSSAEVAGVAALIAGDAERLGELADARARLVASRDELLEERMVLRRSAQFFGASRPARTAHDEAPLLGTYEDDLEPETAEFDIDEEDPLGGGGYGGGPTEGMRGYRGGRPAAPGGGSGLVGSGLGGSGGLSGGRFSAGGAGDGAEFVTGAGDVIGGVIDRTRSAVLERLCWRVTRGNLAFARYEADDADASALLAAKDVFLVFTHGAQTAARVRRICESLDARLVAVSPTTRAERLELVNDQLQELFTVLDRTDGTFRLEQELVSRRLPGWIAVVAKERAIYEALNHFSADHGRQGLIGEAWVPSDQVEDVTVAAQDLSAETSQLVAVHTVRTGRVPPTFHTTNKVTAGFQAMVDIYGIARHGEVNPGLPTTVTFPFLFAVMFGDVGHGFILFLFAFVMVWREKRISEQRDRGELFDMAFGGRYVLLLMGLFSMYTGFIYNDLFSRTMTIFNSAWKWSPETGNTATRIWRHVYPLGLDPAWHGAENNLRFTNSYKMKLSVLLGVAHMTYSLAFSLVNARHFHSWIDVWGNFVPSMIFMQSIFGYLALTIVYKWCVDWIGTGFDPPGLLDMLIKMFLSPGSVDPPLYRGQAAVQILLLLCALVCVPWLLLFKPMYLRRQQQRLHIAPQPLRLDEHTFALDEDEGNELQIYDDETPYDDHGAGPAAAPPAEHVEHGHNESFGDIMIHQVIHTIEFCLNCVSHTASYLRLWALSLAHSQLSIVLWNMTLRNAFGPTGAKGIVMVVCLFAMWFVITVLVLVCMEGTSAMLHALRLQWVEAMSKHFEGEGYAFEPLDLRALQ